MSVRIITGDCLTVLPQLAAEGVRAHAVVCDPPYHLTTDKKGGSGPASASLATPHGRARITTGFMGQAWDGGRTAFEPETWVAVMACMRPGAFLTAFGGTRTYHRLVCAIEDAGFEIRDSLAFMYATGFPKSLDVSKAIDKCGGADIGWFGPWLRVHREAIGLSQKDLAERGGFYKNTNHGGLVANWELGYGIPTAEQFNSVCSILSLPFRPIDEVKREVIGQRKVNRGLAFTSDGPAELDITAPATPEAAAWAGWGTALKPAMELICLARKPLEGTVAANVLRHGCGGLNIDASRVGNDGGTAKGSKPTGLGNGIYGAGLHGACDILALDKGRWPANILLDGSAEVEAAFAAFGTSQTGKRSDASRERDVPGTNWLAKNHKSQEYTDTGTASRFFFSAKADAGDRAGSAHPTVKPADLMRWLVQLTCPPGGLVLDPFAGTGSTGLAADQLGMDAILIEKDAIYAADARRKISADAGLFSTVVTE